MGSFNSGRWQHHQRRLTVEECHQVDIKAIRGAMQGEPPDSWRSTCFAVQWSDGRTEYLALTATTPYFGGTVLWLLCPRCARRCGKLYCPPGAHEFRCRQCYDLTYRSSLESRKATAFWQDFAASLQDRTPGITAQDVLRILRNAG